MKTGPVPITLLLAAVLVAASAAVVLDVGCVSEPVPVDRPRPLPPGDTLPPAVDAMMYGSAQACRVDADCPGRVCYYGSCVGLLIVDQRWMQEAIAAEIKAAVTRREALRPRVVGHFERVLQRTDTDLAFRARAVVALEALGATEPLRVALGDPDERLQSAAALALARLGEADGVPLVRALTEHDETAIACEALRALGDSKSPDALVPILRSLNPSFDGMVLRSAVDGLRRLGDIRATRPLVDLLTVGPEYLDLVIVDTLRVLTGATVGRDTDGWRSWVDEHNPARPPEFEVRAFDAEADLGLPTP